METPEPKPFAEGTNLSRISNQTALLASVVDQADDGEFQKVARALKRTEALLPEPRFYFFQTIDKPMKPKPSSFPVKAVPQNWLSELKNPQVRYQTFVSGFAEDVVGLGKLLPDEIILWLINEICVESDDVLRTSYCNTLRQSGEQIGRLVVPELVQCMLQNLGGDETAMSKTEKIRTVQKLFNPYGNYNWDQLQSTIKTLGVISIHLQQHVRTHIVCMLLRMGCDRSVSTLSQIGSLNQ